MTMETANLRCWGHRDEAASWNCSPGTCTAFSAAQVLEDRVAAIEYLAKEARQDLDNDAEPRLPITAVLEAVRILASSISDPMSVESVLTSEGSDTLRWTVLRMAEASRLRAVEVEK